MTLTERVDDAIMVNIVRSDDKHASAKAAIQIVLDAAAKWHIDKGRECRTRGLNDSYHFHMESSGLIRALAGGQAMTLTEKVARETALLFADNRQPDMSGDTFKRLTPSRKRDCYDAARTAIAIVVEEAAKVAKNGCLVPPDGGSPTEDDVNMCDNIATAIMALAEDKP